MSTHAARRLQPGATLAYGAVALALASVLVLILMTHVFSQTLAPESPKYVDVVVLPGDTLWEIARRHTAPGEDTRRTVDAIRAANSLDSAVLRPGLVLKVPVR